MCSKKRYSIYQFTLFLCFAFTVPAICAAELAKSAEGAEVYIISPQDGATVSSPFTVQFGLKGMGIAPAGVDMPNTGHHHLLIDLDKLPDMTAPMAASDNIKHFGGGQTEVELNLLPGKHTLQLVLGDYLHRPHDEPVISKKISVTVVK